MMRAMRGVRLYLILFVAGGIGGALCDQLHTQLGVLHYREPVIFGQAWWVVPLFGAGTIVVFAAASAFLKHAALLPWLSPASLAGSGSLVAVRGAEAQVASSSFGVRAEPRAFVTGNLWFVGAYVLTCFFFEHPYRILAILTVTWVARMVATPHRSLAIPFSILLGIAGPAWEMFLTSTGVYAFEYPDLFRVPAWLPGLYMQGAPLALLYAESFARAMGGDQSAVESAGGGDRSAAKSAASGDRVAAKSAVSGDRVAAKSAVSGDRSAAESAASGDRSAAESAAAGDRVAAKSAAAGDRSAEERAPSGDRSAPTSAAAGDRSAAKSAASDARSPAESSVSGYRSAAESAAAGARPPAQSVVSGDRSVAESAASGDRSSVQSAAADGSSQSQDLNRSSGLG